ncbi:hypothetical protein KPH14_005262 [Odynerus spinipes]|uniref:Uncharacterized protein n=1 Tax=Odynerus spinipes TaxID=1348599 RepID=A0AAD9RBB9_9HYME|nr:hypothetical protein KPH14_005262 [Odynerus spinipes]
MAKSALFFTGGTKHFPGIKSQVSARIKYLCIIVDFEFRVSCKSIECKKTRWDHKIAKVGEELNAERLETDMHPV